MESRESDIYLDIISSVDSYRCYNYNEQQDFPINFNYFNIFLFI